MACFVLPAQAQWVQADSLRDESIAALAVGPTSAGSTIFAGTFNHGVFRSTDNGETWDAANNGLQKAGVVTLAIVPGSSMAGESEIFAGTEYDGIFRSTDGGKNWIAVNKGLWLTGAEGRVNTRSSSDARFGRRVNVLLSKQGSRGNDNLFAGLYSGGVFRTTNSGASWVAVNGGMSEAPPAGVMAPEPRAPTISALTFSSDYLFAGTYGNGVFLSTNNGASWTEVSNGLPLDERFIAVFAFAVTPGSGGMESDNLFAGTTNGGVFLTKDDGRYWAATNAGLPNDNVVALATSPTTGGTNLFAGLLGSGVFLSTDNGKRWTDVNAGLSNRNVFALAVAGDSLLAGTSGGVWRRSIPEMLAETRNRR
jgi:hypothetical protein